MGNILHLAHNEYTAPVLRDLCSCFSPGILFSSLRHQELVELPVSSASVEVVEAVSNQAKIVLVEETTIFSYFFQVNIHVIP